MGAVKKVVIVGGGGAGRPAPPPPRPETSHASTTCFPASPVAAAPAPTLAGHAWSRAAGTSLSPCRTGARLIKPMSAECCILGGTPGDLPPIGRARDRLKSGLPKSEQPSVRTPPFPAGAAFTRPSQTAYRS